MAKIIETRDGIRLLVSDDTPEDIDYDTPEEVVTPKTALTQQNSVDPVTMVISFENNKCRDLFVKGERVTFLDAQKNSVVISGLMTLEDFISFAEHQDKTVSGVSTASFQLLQGAYRVDRLTGKDMNVFAVKVNLSLKRHT